jgi:hypothetical protein
MNNRSGKKTMNAESTQNLQALPNRFVDLAAVNVGAHIEKKGKLSYLSWAWALDQLLRRDPAASWSYADPIRFGNTMMVVCTVTAFGQPRTMQLPVMNHLNKAIENPDAFAVNTAMQRCLVKAIALHGLGLYIYAGEDLPMGESEDEPKPTPLPRAHPASGAATDAFDALGDEAQAYIQTYADAVIELFGTNGDVMGYLAAHTLDTEEKLALWSRLPSNVRSAIKAAQKETQPTERAA